MLLRSSKTLLEGWKARLGSYEARNSLPLPIPNNDAAAAETLLTLDITGSQRLLSPEPLQLPLVDTGRSSFPLNPH